MSFKGHLISAFCVAGCLFCGCGGDSGSDDINGDSEECKALHCEAIVGGREQACYTINGEVSCKPSCLGEAEGKNDGACWRNLSVADSKWESVIDTCNKDDNGHLYSVDSQSTPCPISCQKGVCQEDYPGCENLHCENDGGESQGCFKINGQLTCKEPCSGDKVGANKASCGHSSLSVDDEPYAYSITEKCEEDDTGKLYVANRSENICTIGCTDGHCDELKKCNTDNECKPVGGREQKCFLIEELDIHFCAPVCLEETRDHYVFACYKDDSVPNATWQVVMDICVRDGEGNGYYSVDSSVYKECGDKGCNNGKCNE